MANSFLNQGDISNAHQIRRLGRIAFSIHLHQELLTVSWSDYEWQNSEL
jgi:hypothetical protein